MKTKKIKTVFFVVFLMLASLLNLSITTPDGISPIMRQISNTSVPVLQVINAAKQDVPERIHIFVSEESVHANIVNHAELDFDLSLFTFTGWKDKPELSETYAYMYEDDYKFVAFIGPQESISPNVPAHELGHMASALVGRVSSNDKWMQICYAVWKEKEFNSYFIPSGHTVGYGFTSEEQAAEELFAESIAYLSEGKLDEFMGSEAVVAEEFIMNLPELYAIYSLKNKN